MRIKQIFLVLAVVCMLFVLIDAKQKWKKKKHMSKKGKSGHHHGLGNNVNKQKRKMNRMMKKMKKMEGNGDWSSTQYFPRIMKKVSPKKHIAWLKLRSEKDCPMKCEKGEVCIVGPVDSKLMCVHKKNIKKSMKLFHKYQKKEMKAWHAFKTKHYNKAEDDDSVYFSKFDAEKKEHTDKKDTDMMKPHHKGKGKHHHEHHKNLECSVALFSQMRKRMMGWFHLLHGQDHLSHSSQEKKNIKHFHKNNSFKKEQRNFQGAQCECASSAMWQFHKMDKNRTDDLTHDEISIMYENQAEPCLKPFVTSCDLNGDEKLSSDEWCCCFSNIVAPCFQKLQEIRDSAIAVQYIPRCDKEGYYRREQCSGEKHGSYKCWCVDYNGNVFKDSEKDGRAHCDKMEENSYEMKDVSQ